MDVYPPAMCSRVDMAPGPPAMRLSVLSTHSNLFNLPLGPPKLYSPPSFPLHLLHHLCPHLQVSTMSASHIHAPSLFQPRRDSRRRRGMLELTGWSEDVMPRSSLHSTEGLMCHNHRAGLVVTAPQLPAPLAAPALPACGIFWNRSPPRKGRGA